MGKISAGSYDLNKWLHGGYEDEVVSMIYGASGTGKTNFCLLAAVSQARKGKKVIFIDSEGGFSSERVKQIEPTDFEKVLENIILLKPTNFSEQREDFKKMLKYLRDDSQNQIGLIIADGMTILYRLDFSQARTKGQEEMSKVNSILVEQIKTLADIARKKGIPVILTNQVYKWDENSNMVGGDILKYWAKCHIELLKEGGKRLAVLRKHRSLPEKILTFQIYSGGVRKKGWI